MQDVLRVSGIACACTALWTAVHRARRCSYRPVSALASVVVLVSGMLAGLPALAETPLRTNAADLVDCTVHLKSNYRLSDPFSRKPEEWRSKAHGPVPAEVTSVRLQDYLAARNPRYDHERFGLIAALYEKWGKAYGLRWDLLFFQMLHETNFLKYTGGVKKTDNNFTGLGATVEGKSGAKFSSVEAGVQAHVQHLASYALVELEPHTLVRERDDSTTLRQCDKFAARCQCIKRTKSYSHCLRNWIMREVCRRRGRPASLEFLDEMFASRNDRPDLLYSAKVLRIYNDFRSRLPR